MTTVSYDLQIPGCSGNPYFKEDDYSIHLQNRLSREELREALHGLNEIVRTYYPRRILVWLMLLMMIFPWIIYIILITNLGWNVGLLIGFLIAQYIPLFAWIFYYYRRLRLLRENFEIQIGFINQKYYNRGINFRLRTSGSPSNNGRRAFFSLDIEVGQQGMPLYQAPQFYAPPPIYNSVNYPPNYSAPPNYTP